MVTSILASGVMTNGLVLALWSKPMETELKLCLMGHTLSLKFKLVKSSEQKEISRVKIKFKFVWYIIFGAICGLGEKDEGNPRKGWKGLEPLPSPAQRTLGQQRGLSHRFEGCWERTEGLPEKIEPDSEGCPRCQTPLRRFRRKEADER